MSETRVRQVLNHWMPWMVIAYIGLVGVVVYGYTLNARTLRDEAIRQAELSAAHEAAVARCLGSRPQLMRVTRFVEGENDLAETLVQNSAAALEATPGDDPQYATRKANLVRLIRARENVKAIASFPVPTVAQCRKMG